MIDLKYNGYAVTCDLEPGVYSFQNKSDVGKSRLYRLLRGGASVG